MTAPCSTRGPEGSIPKTKTAPPAEADEAAVGSHVSPPCGGDGDTLIAPTPPRPAPCEVIRTVSPIGVSQRRAATISVFEHNQHPNVSTEPPTLRCSHDAPGHEKARAINVPGPAFAWMSCSPQRETILGGCSCSAEAVSTRSGRSASRSACTFDGSIPCRRMKRSWKAASIAVNDRERSSSRRAASVSICGMGSTPSGVQRRSSDIMAR